MRLKTMLNVQESKDTDDSSTNENTQKAHETQQRQKQIAFLNYHDDRGDERDEITETKGKV